MAGNTRNAAGKLSRRWPNEGVIAANPTLSRSISSFSSNKASTCLQYVTVRGWRWGGFTPSGLSFPGIDRFECWSAFCIYRRQNHLIHFILKGIFFLCQWANGAPPTIPPPSLLHVCFQLSNAVEKKQNNLSNWRNISTWLRPLNPTCTISLFRLLQAFMDFTIPLLRALKWSWPDN